MALGEGGLVDTVQHRLLMHKLLLANCQFTSFELVKVKVIMHQRRTYPNLCFAIKGTILTQGVGIFFPMLFLVPKLVVPTKLLIKTITK